MISIINMPKLEITCEKQEPKAFCKCFGDLNRMYENAISMKRKHIMKRTHDKKKKEMADSYTLSELLAVKCTNDITENKNCY